jgi:nitrite reductase (NO-forming)
MKKIGTLLVIGAFGLSVILTSCGGGGNQPAATQEQPKTEQVQPAAPVDENAAMMARGEELYKTKCFACHQANGAGLPNAFPSLIGSDFLLNQTKLAVAQVLNGSVAVPASRRVKYPAPMPPQLDNKKDAVAVINYVIKNFGNDGKLITEAEVADIVINPR